MSRQSKILYAVILVLLVTATLLSGAALRADGTGTTLEIAKNSARNELAAYIQTNVISSQSLKISEYDDGKSLTKEQLFYEESQVSVSLELLGVEFSQPITQDGQVRITAYLTEHSIPQYTAKLLLIKQNIESIEERNSHEADLITRKQNLLILLGYYEDFESYATIVTTLQGDVGLPTLTNTKAGVQLDYLLLLRQESDQLQTELDAMTRPSLASEAMQQQAQIQLVAIEQKIKQNQREEAVLRDAQSKQQRDLIELANVAIKQSVDAMNQRAQLMIESLSQRNESTKAEAMIQRIEEQKQAYAQILLDLETTYKTQAAIIEQEYTNRINELKNSSYRIGEMVGGFPTTHAKDLRNTQIEEMMKEKEQKVKSLRLRLEESVQSQRDTVQKMIISEYKKLEGTDFIIQSIQDEIQIKIGNYDGHRKSWPIAIRFTVLDRQFSFDYYVPYETITGNPLPSFAFSNTKDYEAYDAYLDQVDLFETFLLTTQNAVFVEVQYKVSPNSAASEYSIIPELLMIKRADTAKKLIERSNTELYSQTNSFVYYPRTELDFTYSSYFTTTVEQFEQKQRKQSIKKSTQIRMDSNPQLYYRQGLYQGLGLGYLPTSSSPIEMSATALSLSITGYYTPMQCFYVGASFDWNFSFYNSETSSSTTTSTDNTTSGTSMYGLFPLVGCFYPIELEGAVLKPFIDVRFAMAESWISVINLGIHLTEVRSVKDPIDIFISLSYQMTGLNSGLWNVSIGMNWMDLLYYMA